jgi:hypothetical protein
MTIDELRPGLIVQYGSETLKVSTIYGPDRVTAQVMMPVPPRTTVRAYNPTQVAKWRPASAQAYNKYCDAYDNPAAW